MTNLNKQWNELFKNKKQVIDADSDIEIQVLEAPKPASKNSSLEFFANRKDRENKMQTVINLQGHPSNVGLSNLLKPLTSISRPFGGQQKKKEKQQVFEVVNVDRQNSKNNLEKYKKSIFQAPQPEMKVRKEQAIQKDKIFQQQMRIIQEANKPAWQVYKDERRIINREKYPNSSTTYFSAMNQQSDETYKQYQKKREERKIISKERKIKQKQEEKIRQKEQIRMKKTKQQRDLDSLLATMIGIQPQKIRKIDAVDGSYTFENAGLKNDEILQHLDSQEENQVEVKIQERKQKAFPRQHRLGLNDNIQSTNQAPHFFIQSILKHKFSQQFVQKQNKKIPDFFQDRSVYKKSFHYLIINECIADLRHKLKNLEKTNREPMKISINHTRANTDGQVELYLEQKSIADQGEFQLQNYCLSRNRLGLICSSHEYLNQYYGVPGRRGKQFAFIVMLATPETKQQLGSQVKALSTISENELEYLLKKRKSKQAFFFDLDKLSTHIREYLAVTNAPYSDLAPIIFNPKILEEQMRVFVQQRDVLENILGTLKQIFNDTQWQSIKEMVYHQRGFVLLQGPPGTGKTSTLMGLISAQYEYLKRIGDTRKIMICAPSNAAINHIVKRIVQEGLISGDGELITPKIIRTGIVDTEDDDIRSVSLDDVCQKILIESNETARKLSQMTTAQIRENIISLQKQIKKLSRVNSPDLQRKKNDLIQLQNKLFYFRRQKNVLSRKNYNLIESKVIGEADIILTTLSSSGNERFVSKIRGEIACLIVDEAAQATEPNLLVALQTGVSKVLLIGDPYQLPATCISQDANITLLNRSIFERFLDAGIKPYFLNIQYRMASLIREFPSCQFYDNRLVDGETITSRQRPPFLTNFQGRNVLFIDIKKGVQQKRDDSYANKAQAKIVSLLVRCLVDESISLGVITPYQAQRRLIVRTCFDAMRQSTQDKALFQKKVMINTVDSFQGQERDIIIVSNVRANHRQAVGFLTDERRTNVTLTRAKHLLIVVGHGDTLGSNEVWNQFLEYVQIKKLYYEIHHDANSSKTENAIGMLFQGEENKKVTRRRYERMSSDVRKIERNQIQSKDFQRKKKSQMDEYPSYAMLSPTRMIPEKDNMPKKHALNEEESKKIVQKKLQREAQELKVEQMLQRMKQYEVENKESEFYKSLFG